MSQFQENRDFLKSKFPQLQQVESDEKRKIAQPPLEKPYDQGDTTIDLPKVTENVVEKSDVYACLRDRRSVRKYIEEDMTQEQLSFLLWATQGVDKVVGNNKKATYRPVPSGGARHPFETYLVINRVEGIEKGLYRYLPLSHQLLQIKTGDLSQELVEATMHQRFVANAAVTFLWSCIPYRSEWRYNVAAHKMILIDIGHVCQNLYIACEAIGQSTCAAASFDQEKMDGLIGVDGQEEFLLYFAPVGRRE